jgi:uncharacterized protein (TIGR03032 family)
MQLAQPFVKLPFRFDTERLRAEVEALPDDAWRRHPTGHKGNTAVSLVSIGGDHTDDSIGGQQATTGWLQPDSYIAQTIASFGVPVGRTRLMRIDPGGEATPHFDVHLYWFDRVRIHVPIITTEDVTFECGDASVHMEAGDSWVFDTFRRHNVLNPSDHHRVHLVIDTVGTPALWDMIRAGVDGAEPDASQIPYEAGRTPMVLPESFNIAPVMPPAQMQSIWQRLAPHVPADGNGIAIHAAVDQYIETWQTLWALHGSTPHAAGYVAEVGRFVAELRELPDTVIAYNNSSAQSTVATLLAASALAAQPDRNEAPSPPIVRVTETAVPDASDDVPGDPRFDRPVIIVSPPRAGSTLLFETLAKAPNLFTIGRESHMLIESIRGLRPVDNDWASNELTAEHATPEVAEAIRSAFFKDLRDRNEQPPPMEGKGLRLLEKTPKNALRIEFLDKVFPDARFIYLSRPPRAEISSMIDAWRSGGFATYPDLPGWEGIPWSLLLIPGWKDLIGKSVQEVCAAQWQYTTNKILDDLDRVAPGRWTVANYHRLVADPNAEIARLCRFAELPWDEPLDGPLPLSRHTLTPPSPDKWRRNTTELHEVLGGVKETAERANRVSGGPAAAAPSAQSAAPKPAAASTSSVELAGADAGQHPMGSVHTSSVPELLGKTGFSLLMSTYQSGKMVTLREMDGVLNTHFTPFPRPMGIAWRPNGPGGTTGAGALSIGTRDEVWTYRDQPAVAHKIEPKGSYGSSYVMRNRHVTGDIAIHEMAYASDGELWVVNTRFSCLTTIDSEHSFVPRWMPPFITGLGPEDRCHLNGMAMRDGAPKYVTMFSESDQPHGWRDTKAFGGLVMDVDSNEIITTGLCMPHSPRWYRNELFVLESGKGTLSRVNLDSGETESITKLPGFTRGLAFIGRYAIIGLSQVRESVFAGIPLTQTNEPRHSGVWIVDLDSGEIVGFVRFDGLVQEVFDLQVIVGSGAATDGDGKPTGRHVHLMELENELHNKSFVVPAEAMSGV